jgi:hypothetical protein
MMAGIFHYDSDERAYVMGPNFKADMATGICPNRADRIISQGLV